MSINDFISNATKRIAKNSQVKEIDIEESFCAYAKSQGCIAFKLVMLNRKGFPDRTVLCPGGKIMFVEFKRKGKTTTNPQSKIRNLLTSLGFEYYVCDQLGQAENHLDLFLAFS